MFQKIQPIDNLEMRMQLPDCSKAIWSRLSDFWLLGGLSIVLCIVMQIANLFRGDLQAFQLRFMQLGAVFSILSILCNYPHFLISYRLGYGRGRKFIFKHWFPLIAVPMVLVTVYGIAFFYFNSDIPDSQLVRGINSVSHWLGLSFHIGVDSAVGKEIVGLTIWLMYITVGWHYCKQVYGCMMVYAKYDRYPLTSFQKKIFKWSTISVAIYQFFYMTTAMELSANRGAIQDPRFQGFNFSTIGLPTWPMSLSIISMIVLGILALLNILTIHKNLKKWPSINFLTPWIAFYVWWIPFGHLPEYYLLMVPFFHSLQYLPFAFRVEREKIPENKFLNLQISLRIILLVFVSFMAFELIPSLLDKSLETDINQTAWFFVTIFAVFINIHHFFIDSVSWKFNDVEVKQGLLYRTSSK